MSFIHLRSTEEAKKKMEEKAASLNFASFTEFAFAAMESFGTAQDEKDKSKKEKNWPYNEQGQPECIHDYKKILGFEGAFETFKTNLGETEICDYALNREEIINYEIKDLVSKVCVACKVYRKYNIAEKAAAAEMIERAKASVRHQNSRPKLDKREETKDDGSSYGFREDGYRNGTWKWRSYSHNR